MLSQSSFQPSMKKDSHDKNHPTEGKPVHLHSQRKSPGKRSICKRMLLELTDLEVSGKSASIKLYSEVVIKCKQEHFQKQE